MDIYGVDDAKEIGGRWTNSLWVFKSQDEPHVRKMLMDIYGVDGSPPEVSDLVNVQITLDKIADCPQIWFAGRNVASRMSRDYKRGHLNSWVNLGKDCVLISGGFPASGGTRNVKADTGTVVEIRGVPAHMADKAITDRPEAQGKIVSQPERGKGPKKELFDTAAAKKEVMVAAKKYSYNIVAILLMDDIIKWMERNDQSGEAAIKKLLEVFS